MNKELSIVALEPGIMLRPWGGERLGKLFSVPLSGGERVGESWNISVHPDAPSLVSGHPLSQWISGEQMPYLVKLIDTADNLSVQVHPDDQFAKKFENARGKSECWLILEAGADSGIYLGLRPGVSKKLFEKSLRNGEDISGHLNFRKVSPGDFFYVPAGTLHAIGKGIFLAEVQQNSGITYRVWDWGRKDRQGRSRELHIEKALQVARFDRESNTEECFKVKRGLYQSEGVFPLLQHSQFHLTLHNLGRGQTCPLGLGERDFVSSLLVLEGKGILKNSRKKVDVSPFQSYLLKEGVVVESREQLKFISIS